MYPKRKEAPRNFLEAIVGESQRQAQSQRVAEVVASGDIDQDLRQAIEVRETQVLSRIAHTSQSREKGDVSIPLSLHDRSFDLVLLSNWEDQIIYEPDEYHSLATHNQANLTTPSNKALEEGSWTQSIIWSPRAPFRDFTQLELNEEDILQEERHPSMYPFQFESSSYEIWCSDGE